MTLVTIALMGAVTFGLRFAFFGPLTPQRISPHLEQALPHVMPAVLMALVVPAVLPASYLSGDSPTWLTPALAGALTGFAVGAVRRDSFLLVFGSGMAAFALTGFLL
ncbi:AzlD domain-containing protein [Streptomyces smyrnaeus]|uniref:AzlD domain-containing protein n=1 Tax=Streptomyces smyrnaeus TaxID=1387713 RepID=UPI0033A93565